jgi:hypothetical protein
MILGVNRDHFLNSFKKLILVMETCCALFEVRTEFLSMLFKYSALLSNLNALRLLFSRMSVTVGSAFIVEHMPNWNSYKFLSELKVVCIFFFSVLLHVTRKYVI